MGYQAQGKYTQILNTYVSKPEGEGPFPTIILFMHAYGIDDAMKKVCDDLAAEGFLTLGADAYLNGSFSFQSRSEDVIFESLNLIMNWLKTKKIVDQNNLGLIGFCMGGRHAYIANARLDEFKAVVSYYGFPQRGTSVTNTPQNLIDQFTAPVLSIFGSEDQGIPMEIVKAYQAESEKEGRLHSSIVYEGAGHGFLNPYSPRHHEEASKDAWVKTIDHFKKYLES